MSYLQQGKVWLGARVDKRMLAESAIEVLQWVVAGTVVAMVIPVSERTGSLFAVAVVMVAAFLVAAPTNYLLKWMEQQLTEEWAASDSTG